jgi:hypothetical protein
MSDEIDKVAEQSLEFFELVTTEKETPKSLAAEYGLSLKTVYNRINRGRELIQEQIKLVGDKFLADIWLDYERVKKAAWKGWERSVTNMGGDVNFLKEYRAVLEAQRKMLSIDSPSKAPVNENGETVQNQLIFVFDEKEYDVKEIEFQERKEISGDFKLLDGSTEVPLTPAQNEVESDSTQ